MALPKKLKKKVVKTLTKKKKTGSAPLSYKTAKKVLKKRKSRYQDLLDQTK